ncbi:unnamed protein product, partial [Rotaria magnacalcarata]
MNQIAFILEDEKKYDEAYDYYQRVNSILTKLEKNYPSYQLQIANSLRNIGNVLYLQDKNDEAIEYKQR